jgi:hypothetical protein
VKNAVSVVEKTKGKQEDKWKTNYVGYFGGDKKEETFRMIWGGNLGLSEESGW